MARSPERTLAGIAVVLALLVAQTAVAGVIVMKDDRRFEGKVTDVTVAVDAVASGQWRVGSLHDHPPTVGQGASE